MIMAGMLERMPARRADEIAYLSKARGYLKEPSREQNGQASVRLAYSTRFLAIAAYKLDHDIPAFRAGLRECGEIYVRLFERMDAGEPIDQSYLSMITYQNLFNPLAAGDFDLSPGSPT